MKQKKQLPFGPAVLVTAAFIGPGTVMMASGAGAEFGYTLLWAVAFSAIATMILQEMAARLGVVTSSGLSQAIKSSFSHPVLRFAALGLVLVAILIGNAAYQTGNILGAANGVIALQQPVPIAERDVVDGSASAAVSNQELNSSESASGMFSQNVLVFLIGGFALVVIGIGRFDILQWVLTLLVALMGILFVVAALLGNPDWQLIAEGFVPRIPRGEQWFVVGLIGTTVVPYNLFLHANAAALRWSNSDGVNSDPDQIRKSIVSSRWDTIISVSIGGLVTASILVTAAAAFHSADSRSVQSFANVRDVAVQLKPLGSWSPVMFAIGLLAAGLTSAITAPIAAAYATAGCFGWPAKLSDWRLKLTASAVVITGVLFAVKFGKSPVQAIITAQVANGLLLPVIATFLLFMVNRKDLMKQYRNRRMSISNLLGVIVVVIVSLIAIRSLGRAGKGIQEIFQSEPAKVSRLILDKHGAAEHPKKRTQENFNHGPTRAIR